MIMFFIAGGTGLGTLTAVIGGGRLLTDHRHRLRPDRILVASSSSISSSAQLLPTIFTIMTLVRPYRSQRTRRGGSRPEGRARARRTKSWVDYIISMSESET